MNPIVHYSILLLIPSVILLHLYYAPYTKVEESFSVQAVHDIIRFGVPLNSNASQHVQSYYDHVDFPGAVPRTFVGALVLSQATSIALNLLKWTQLIRIWTDVQILARAILGLANAGSLLLFSDAIKQAYGTSAQYWFILFTTGQFHIMYYASRTLPNMFAFALTTLSLRSYILSNFGARARRTRRARLCLYLLTTAGVIFRSELALLLLFITISYLFKSPTSSTFSIQTAIRTLREIILPSGITALFTSLLATVLVDSFFWGTITSYRPIWPEWIAFRFNALQGKSEDWGTEPLTYYFVNSIPKLLMNPAILLLCVPIALSIKGTRRFSMGLLGPSLAFVGAYSILPHKEWRFIVYIIPCISGVAAAGAAAVSARWARGLLWKVGFLVIAVSVVGTYVVSGGLLVVSSLNYPGGEALSRLNEIVASKGYDHADQEQQADGGVVRVHLDNLSCQTGVTRFLMSDGENGLSRAVFDKTENEVIKTNSNWWRQFEYVLAEPDATFTHVKGDGWKVVDTVNGFAGVRMVRDMPASFDLESLKMKLKMQGRYTEWQIDALLLWQWFEYQARTRITKGRWIEARMEPKILIFQNSHVSV